MLKAALAAGTLGFLVWHLGTGPFLDGLRAVDAAALATATGLAVITTVCCAWRWQVVARDLGDDLPLGTAVASYYCSLFLNVTLPGGVVGDVHRGISHGLRAVVWERTAGQIVQIARVHAGEKWNTLTIPRGGSEQFNKANWGGKSGA